MALMLRYLGHSRAGRGRLQQRQLRQAAPASGRSPTTTRTRGSRSGSAAGAGFRSIRLRAAAARRAATRPPRRPSTPPRPRASLGRQERARVSSQARRSKLGFPGDRASPLGRRPADRGAQAGGRVARHRRRPGSWSCSLLVLAGVVLAIAGDEAGRSAQPLPDAGSAAPGGRVPPRSCATSCSTSGIEVPPSATLIELAALAEREARGQRPGLRPACDRRALRPPRPPGRRPASCARRCGPAPRRSLAS